MQRAAAGRVDVHAVTLLARHRARIALVDGKAHPCPLQALREAKAANAAADDDDVQRSSSGHDDAPSASKSSRNCVSTDGADAGRRLMPLTTAMISSTQLSRSRPAGSG